MLGEVLHQEAYGTPVAQQGRAIEGHEVVCVLWGWYKIILTQKGLVSQRGKVTNPAYPNIFPLITLNLLEHLTQRHFVTIDDEVIQECLYLPGVLICIFCHREHTLVVVGRYDAFSLLARMCFPEMSCQEFICDKASPADEASGPWNDHPG